MAKAPTPKHLTATTRVMRTHFARPSFTIGNAREQVQDLALRLRSGEATKNDQVLEEKLRKATGVSVSELAHFAEHWPDV